jgi:hypothetical protein
VFTIFPQFQRKAVVTDTRQKREPNQDLNHCQAGAKGTQTKSIPKSPRIMLPSARMQEQQTIVTAQDQTFTVTADRLSFVEVCRRYLLRCILYFVNFTTVHQMDILLYIVHSEHYRQLIHDIKRTKCKTCSSDIHIVISHRIFPRVSVQREPTSAYVRRLLARQRISRSITRIQLLYQETSTF